MFVIHRSLGRLDRHMYHVLTHGHIVQYHLKASKTAHYHRSRTINLLDAYVYSGQLALSSISHSSEFNAQAVPKRYQDGLETEDLEEDVTFVIW